MRFRIMLFLTCLTLLAVFAPAQFDYYLPQVANGVAGNFGLRTSFIFFNNSIFAADVTLRLTDDNGNPMSVTFPSQAPGSEFNIPLGAGETRILETNGQGDLIAGAAHVSSDMPIGVSGVFSIYIDGVFTAEAGIGASTPVYDFIIPVDATGLFNTGLALFNSDETDANLTLTLRDTAGAVLNTTDIVLGAGRHTAQFVAGGFFPGVSNIRGTLEVASDIAIAAQTLRQYQTPLSYTSIPVVPVDSFDTEFFLPQVANGGGFKTTFLVFNLSETPSDVTLTLTKDDGSPFPVTIPGTKATGSQFQFTLGAYESRFLQTDGSGDLTAGAAMVTTTSPVGVSSIFTYSDGAGNFITEAGVGNSLPMDASTLPVDLRECFNTGVAFFNFGDTTVTLTLRLIGQNGVRLATADPIQLGPKAHMARFVSELFPGFPTVQGTLSISASDDVAQVTLRQSSCPLVFTSLPVAEGSIEGLEPGPTSILLDKEILNVDGTFNRQIDVQLPGGYKLSGVVSGAGVVPTSVSAESIAQDFFYSSAVNASDGYLIVLPAGTYRLIVDYSDTQGPFWVEYTDPVTVTVNADTVRDIAVPPVTGFNVIGTVSGLNKLPANSFANLAFSRNDNLAGASSFIMPVIGSFNTRLPNGTYAVSLSANMLSGSLGLLGIHNLGTVTVNNAPVMGANFAVPDLPPLVNLTGNVQLTGLGVPENSSIFAGTNPVSGPANRSYWTSGAVPVNGNYALSLYDTWTYDVRVNIPLSDESFLTFPDPNRVVAMSGNETANFLLGALPGVFTVSGKVTDPGGNGVANVDVIAATWDVTGLPEAVFNSFTTTDANGNYSVPILSGLQYSLFYYPPVPNP